MYQTKPKEKQKDYKRFCLNFTTTDFEGNMEETEIKQNNVVGDAS